MGQLTETISYPCENQLQILLMEDESGMAQGLQMVLSENGYGVNLAMTGQSALDILSQKTFDLLVADLRLPDMDGMEVVKRVKDERPETEVMVITGYANIPSAVEAMKNGAGDYLPKPFTDDEFKEAVDEILKHKKHSSAKEDARFIGAEIETLIQKREVTHVLENVEGAPKDFGEHVNLLNFKENLVDNAVDGIMSCDCDGNIVIFNKRLEKMLGYSQDEVVGKMHFDQFFLVGAAEQFREELYSERYGGKNTLLLFETDLINKTKDKIPVQLSAAVLFDSGSEIGIGCYFKELRETRKVEQEFADQARLLHQDKMMSLGRLAASVVHEINNPLTGILNYIRLMIRVLERESSITSEKAAKFKSYLTLVESETDRCSKIVSNLLAFSRKSTLQFTKIHIFELLEKCIMLSKHKLDLQNIRITSHLDASVPNVLGDYNQIQQCMINLIFNAVDAMPEGGMLTIESCSGSNQKDVEIKIQDTGCGISEENLPKIFDPFFSTKTEGEGLGLGLSTVRGIIDRHGGTIGVESELDKGTIFRITLPKCQD